MAPPFGKILSSYKWPPSQASTKDWQIWPQALQLNFGPKLNIAIPLVDDSVPCINWSTSPITLPLTCSTNLVLMESDKSLQSPPMLWLHSFMQYACSAVATSVPPPPTTSPLLPQAWPKCYTSNTAVPSLSHPTGGSLI